MKTAAASAMPTTEVVPFQFYVPIAKVDKEKRLVTGVVTEEILDKQGDIVDYATAKAFFLNEDLWPGNMREMHQPKAVGKKVSVECDDDTKTITLTSKVSKGAPDTWEKVLDGTLSFYSIMGSGDRVAEVVGGKTVGKRLFLKQLVETSYVDNGACPTAKFEIVKSVDGVLVDAEAADPEETPDPVAKATEALDAAAAAAKPVAVVAGGIRKLVAGLARATDRATQKGVIIAKAIEAGEAFVAELPIAWQPEAVRKGSPEPWDIDRALGAISTLEYLLSNEYYDVIYGQVNGSTPDPVKVAQVAAIKSAIDAVLQFVISEHEQQFAPDASGNGGLDLAPAGDLDTVVEMFVKSLDVVQKAGARHSKKDQEMVQKVHDVSNQLGASCPDAEDDDAAEKAAKAKDPACKTCKDTKKIRAGTVTCPDCKAAKAVELPAGDEPIQKLAADLEATKTALAESQALVAKAAETSAALEARLATLEGQPAAGGPAKNAHARPVEKTIGGGDGTGHAAAGSDDDPVMKAFDTLAAAAKTEPERLDIITKKTTYIHRNGIGATVRT